MSHACGRQYKATNARLTLIDSLDQVSAFFLFSSRCWSAIFLFYFHFTSPVDYITPFSASLADRLIAYPNLTAQHKSS
jgi:hypothetical protein